MDGGNMMQIEISYFSEAQSIAEGNPIGDDWEPDYIGYAYHSDLCTASTISTLTECIQEAAYVHRNVEHEFIQVGEFPNGQ